MICDGENAGGRLASSSSAAATALRAEAATAALAREHGGEGEGRRRAVELGREAVAHTAPLPLAAAALSSAALMASSPASSHRHPCQKLWTLLCILFRKNI